MLKATWFKVPKIDIKILFMSPYSYKEARDLLKINIFERYLDDKT